MHASKSGSLYCRRYCQPQYRKIVFHHIQGLFYVMLIYFDSVATGRFLSISGHDFPPPPNVRMTLSVIISEKLHPLQGTPTQRGVDGAGHRVRTTVARAHFLLVIGIVAHTVQEDPLIRWKLWGIKSCDSVGRCLLLLFLHASTQEFWRIVPFWT